MLDRFLSISRNFLPEQTAVDSNAFAVPWAVMFEALALVIVLAFILERCLALVFESKLFLRFSQNQKAEPVSKGDYKAMIAFVLGVLTCLLYQIDIVAALMSHSHPSVFGAMITGGLVAGGSKASIKLFRDIMGVYSNEYAKAKELAPQESTNARPHPNDQRTVRDSSFANRAVS